MALALREGDYVPDGNGGLRALSGTQELLERVLWKLSVRRGSFPFLPTLGSRLHLLGRAPARERESLAAVYAAEALRDEEVVVTGASLRQEGDRAELTVHLDYHGEALTVTTWVGGLI